MATNLNRRKYNKVCKICGTGISNNNGYCFIHKDKEVQKIHKGFKRDNQGKSYAEYLKEKKKKRKK